jgi:hypothetical protein
MLDIVESAESPRSATAPRLIAALRGLGTVATAEHHAVLRIWLARLAMTGIVGWLLWRLQAIGWDQIWRARPSAPAFYAIVLAAYFVQPTADTLIYRRLLGIPFGQGFSAQLRKRVFNSVLVGYSGELFLMMWARRRVAMSDGRLALLIKDCNVLSAIASTLVSFALLLWVLLDWNGAAPLWLWLAPLAMGAMLLPMILMLRLGFEVLAIRSALLVLGIHLARYLATQALLLGQWVVQLPDLGIGLLARLLALQMVVLRLPLLPGRDLLFIGAGLALSGPLAIPQAELAGMLITTSALQLLMHFISLLATMIWTGNSAGEGGR